MSSGFNELFSQIGRDPNAWLSSARRLKLSADLILNKLKVALEESSLTWDVMNKRTAFMESYMMLIGFAFENLLKGIDIARCPELVDDSKLNMELWRARGGHGISTFAERIASLNSEERELFKRLEEFIFWAGRYPISKQATVFLDSIEPNLTNYKSTDPEMIDQLFDRFSDIITQERQNQSN
jgi:hypothetical protein